MARFEPGDRVVRIQDTSQGNVPVGATGTFLGYEDAWTLNGASAAQVRWDNKPTELAGHDCNGLCENGYGWMVPEQDLDHHLEALIDETDYDTSALTTMIRSMFGGEPV